MSLISMYSTLTSTMLSMKKKGEKVFPGLVLVMNTCVKALGQQKEKNPIHCVHNLNWG